MSVQTEGNNQGETGNQPPPTPTPPPEDSRLTAERQRADKAERELQQLKRNGMTDADRLQSERDDANQRAEKAEKRFAESTKRTEFFSLGRNAGISPQALEAAWAIKKDSLGLDSDDKLTGGDKAIQDLKKNHTYLFANGGQMGSGGGNVPPPPGKSNTTTGSNNRINEWLVQQARK